MTRLQKPVVFIYIINMGYVRRSRELTEDMRLYIPLAGNVVLDLWVWEQGIRVHARSTPTSRGIAQTRKIIFTFMKAHSF